jgi:hypothetical protein
MAKQEINLGSAPNAGDGDPLRTAFNKINENFDELYNSTGGLDLLNVASNVIPATDNTYDLGSPAKRWKHGYFATGSLYVGDLKLSNDGGTLLVQQVTNAGLITEAPIPNSPGVVTTDRIINGANTFSITATGELELNGDPFTGGGGGAGPVQTHLELTQSSFIIQPSVLTTSVSFTRTANGNETDSIDTGLTLARGAIGALYNAEVEQSYNRNTDAQPTGTAWNADGWGNLVGLATRTYTTFYEALNQAVGENIIGAELVMWDTINGKFYKFSFTDWGGDNGGSFAYTRTRIEDPNYFRKLDYATVNNIDVIEDDSTLQIGITRDNNGGIYNPFTEEGWDEDVSPDGTEWNIDGWDDLTDVETRTYTNFYDVYDEAIGNNILGSKAVMYVPSIDKYYAIQWLSWTQNNAGGGFSYLRYEIDLDKLDEGVRFADGTVQKTAYVPTNVKLTAPGKRRIEEVAGYKSVSVTERMLRNLTTTASRNYDDNSIIWFDRTTTTIDEILNDRDAAGIIDNSTVQFSLDNTTWYTLSDNEFSNGDEKGYGVNLNGATVTYDQGDTVYFRYVGGGAPVVWWDKDDLPGGSGYFRGAVIDYHAYTDDATIIGTIHIVDDDGEENITHTEVSSGNTDGENDDLWLVTDEGEIKYRRLDGESSTLKIQWIAKVFYGSENN